MPTLLGLAVGSLRRGCILNASKQRSVGSKAQRRKIELRNETTSIYALNHARGVRD